MDEMERLDWILDYLADVSLRGLVHGWVVSVGDGARQCVNIPTPPP